MRGSSPAATLSLEHAAHEAWDAAIIGAGPAGSVAAVVLGRLGLRVLLVDRAGFPRHKVCGSCLGATAVTALSHLGLGHLLDDHRATFMNVFELRAARRSLSVRMQGGRVLSRRALDAALIEEAIGSGVHFLPRCIASTDESGEAHRVVRLSIDGERREARARVVVAAGGLGFSPSTRHDDARHRVESRWRRARLGGAAVIAGDGADLPRGTVRMIVGRRGYVGLARLEDEQLAVGGAFDPDLVRQHGGLAEAALDVFNESNHAVPDELDSAPWLGAPHLTRRPNRIAGRRLVAVGDAAGFVEPFTGEGMTWAIQTAWHAAALVGEHLQQRDAAWCGRLEQEWARTHRGLVRSRQRRCRLIAELLRHPALLAACMISGRALPGLSRAVVERIHGPIASMGSLTSASRCAMRGGV